jgi:hypothetical protein
MLRPEWGRKMTAKIAIVGGGPKAVAIAIKASVLKDAGL